MTAATDSSMRPKAPKRQSEFIGAAAIRAMIENGAYSCMCVLFITLLGVTIGLGYAIPAVVLCVALVVAAVGVWRWRWSIYGLLVYLPVSGIPILAAYPNTRPAVLAKDLLFVVPAYVGFVLQYSGRGRRIAFRGTPTILLVSLTLLVIFQVFNPSLPSRWVGAIGAKVWLFYIPLLFLGYHLTRSLGDLGRLLGVMSVVSLVPVVVGIVEAVLIYTGRAQLVYGWYGSAASSATQDFAQFSLQGGGTLRRVPSTFSFFYQYFGFLLAMVAVSYAWWRAFVAGTRLTGVGLVIWLLTILASLLCGARASFVFVPLLLGAVLMLEQPRFRLPIGRVVIVVSVFTIASTILGSSMDSVLSFGTSVGREAFGEIFVEAFRKALGLTVSGLGTGIDTNASRYAAPQVEGFIGINGFWYESWYVKVLLELGLGGLIIVAALFGSLIWSTLRRHLQIRDPGLRVVSAALLGLILCIFVLSLKAQYLDLDPINVYFWLFTGMLFRISTLDKQREPDPTRRGGWS